MLTIRRFVCFCVLSLLGIFSPAAAQTVLGTVAATDSADMSWQPYWQVFQTGARKEGLDFKYQIAGERGAESNVLADLRRGRIEIAALSVDSLSELVPEFAILSAPFLFENEQVADYAFDRQLLPSLNALLDEHGLIALQWAEIGWAQFAASQPIMSPSIARGLTLRIVDNTADREFIASLNASPLALALSEIATAIDFEEDGASSRLDGGLVTVSGHYYVTSDHWTTLTLTNHGYKVGLFIADRDWFDELSQTKRDGLSNALSQTQTARAQGRKQAQDSLSFMADTGADIRSLSQSEHQAWVAAGLAAHGPILTRIGGRAQFLYDAINGAKESFLESPEATGAINAAGTNSNLDRSGTD